MFIVLTSTVLKTHEELTQEMLKFDGFSLAEHLHIGNRQNKNGKKNTFFSLSLIHLLSIWITSSLGEEMQPSEY